MATESSKNFILTEEVRKSRRNLLCFSLFTIFVLYLSPVITDLTIAGLKLSLIDNRRLQMLLVGVVFIQTVMYVFRYVVSDKVASLITIEERRDILLDTGMAKTVGAGIQKQLLGLGRQYKAIYPVTALCHKFVELIYPIALSVFTVIWGLVEILPFFTVHLF